MAQITGLKNGSGKALPEGKLGLRKNLKQLGCISCDQQWFYVAPGNLT